MEKVTRYEAYDGATFEHQEDCESYENALAATNEFSDWYGNDNQLCGNYEIIQAQTMMRWLKKNSDTVVNYLSILKLSQHLERE